MPESRCPFLRIYAFLPGPPLGDGVPPQELCAQRKSPFRPRRRSSPRNATSEDLLARVRSHYVLEILEHGGFEPPDLGEVGSLSKTRTQRYRAFTTKRNRHPTLASWDLN